ncbi:putative phosphodiesterase [Bradyrhizobium diazoefficiens]|uniref:metallophosphoesterase family protein n=1 Tax=Bradyrhizobium diazoefficiens TaxID=1355477 RepID=UPI003518DEAD
MTTIAKIAQLSDFHFTANLANKGRAFYKRPFLFMKAKGHDISKVARLYQKIEKLERADGKFDLMLATGDLSTDGSRKAIMNALDFIREGELRNGSSRAVTRGLNAGETRRILLPGNHDRFTRAWVGFQKPGTFFEETLGIPTQYPYVVGYRREGVPNVPDQPAVLFFVFDSTPSIFAQIRRPWRRLARGRLEVGDLDTFLYQANKIFPNGSVKALDGSDMNVRYSNCVRVAVLHHHPMDGNSLTLMENHEAFVQYCFRAGIDLVLFGHEHKEYSFTKPGVSELPVLGAHHEVHLFCCPSASEYSSENGFYTFEFDEVSIQFCFYKWNDEACDFISGGLDSYDRFKPGPRQRFNLARPLA